MSSDLRNLEANYAWRCQSPLTEALRSELARKQMIIDQMRLSEGCPTRWYSATQLEALDDDPDKWPLEPREPLDQQPQPEAKPEPKTVEWDGYTTLTLDSLIAMLQHMRKTHSGETPVMGVEFGGLSSLGSVALDDGCIVIE